MIVIASALLGIIIGTLRARRRNGNRMDILQWAAVHGMIFAVIGLFITIGVERMM